jgi:hypothetical protein
MELSVGDRLREAGKRIREKQIRNEPERARAYADFAQFRIGKGLESKEYLQALTQFMKQFIHDVENSI